MADFIPRNILARSTNWVGDAILCTPVYRALKKNFPFSTLTVVARPWVAGVLEGNPHIDFLVVERKRGLLATRALGERLRRDRFDLGVALPNSFSSAALLKAAGAQRRVGYATQMRSLLLTDPVPMPAWIPRQHQVNYYLYLLKDFCEDFSDVRRLDLHLGAPHRREVDELLEGWMEPGDELVALGPGAVFGTAKRWPPSYYAELAEALIERWGRRVVFVGSEKERPLSDEIIHMSDALAASRRTLNSCGRLSIKGTAALLERCHHFFTNDSGAMHIAAAVGAPTTALFGPTDWETTPPFNPRAHILRDPTECAPCLLRDCPIDHRCMRKLAPELALERYAQASGLA
jgi:heptosyltransferase-2